MSERELLTSYVYRLTSALYAGGVRHVVVSPGSRSTPLAYAFASTKELTLHRQVDERAAAFYALGLAKATNKPVVLLCTSGTAAANYFPAIIEAKYARVPLIILTADRPHELREVGAPQAINQVQLYGEHVKWSVDFPIPDAASQTLPFITRHTARALLIATSAPFGPVHINVPFREPLTIDFREQLDEVHVSLHRGELVPSADTQLALATILNDTERGILIVGELPLQTDLSHVWAFIRALKWPVLVESLSNLRGNIPLDCRDYIMATYDATLKSEAFTSVVAPQTVIRIGAQSVSKFVQQFITNANPMHYIVVDEDAMFRDATAMASMIIHAQLGAWLTELPLEPNIEEAYVHEWRDVNELAMEYIENYMNGAEDEGAAMCHLLAGIPEATDVFVSSSMPIRDIDTFFLPTTRDVRIFANRGANGIDGVISTALGFSQGNERNTVLVIGDLAFLHDTSGLLATRYQQCDIDIVVMNNDGGGIFSYLPQASVPQHYEQLFGTPTGLTMEQVANMYEFEYVPIHDVSQLYDVMQQKRQHIRLIEVFTNREDNTFAHRALWQRIIQGVKIWQS
ncbi:MAG: 2-succinyl-5-enolpyruvyl-6-hydroxy-3-cyclohexene-1-carboxylic-acid synthase [Caryophanon sp.]|nr:2-succinyl-5-enolpyruvyl-6-hydroxy-3-cyclohexene-1-carboxylic-acid synthase [Caryophanon sp.]